MSEPAFFTTSILRKPARLVLRGGIGHAALRVRVGYLHHPTLGHTLIDTGYGPQVTNPALTNDIYLTVYRRLLRPSLLSPAPLAQGLARLELHPEQIETVILTHFHADHLGGLRDLRPARVICTKTSWQALSRKSRLQNALSGVFTSLLPETLEERLHWIEDYPQTDAPLSLGRGWDIAGDGSLLAIDLPGHLEGHFGLCLPHRTHPFLYGVDVQWMLRAVLEDRAPRFPARLIHHDRHAMRQSMNRIRAFAKAGGDVLLCHDPEIHPFDIDPEIDA